MFPVPSPLPESEQKKTATATELHPNPQTCGEFYGHSEAWSDEMSYLSTLDETKFADHYKFAKYCAALYAYLAIELRKHPDYTSEFRFPKELIDQLHAKFDEENPDLLCPEKRRLPEELEKMFGNVKEICKDLNDQIPILDRLILLTTDEGDVVLDPFSGTGTTALSAKQLGRQYVGFELDTQYLKLSEQKLAKVTANSRLGKSWVGFRRGEVVTIRNDDWDDLKRYFTIPPSLEALDVQKIQLLAERDDGSEVTLFPDST